MSGVSITRPTSVAAARCGLSVGEYVAIERAGNRLCTGCRMIKARTKEFFGKATKAPGGLRSRCRECVSVTKQKHYLATRPEARRRQLVYQQNNRAKLYAANSKWLRNRNRIARNEMLAAYGAACNCCGEREPIFLDLDHVNNDGKADRIARGNGQQLVIWLKANGWPRDRYQLLCCNCNQGKARNGGVCPHVRRLHAAA